MPGSAMTPRRSGVPLAVVAVGGNALTESGQRGTAQDIAAASAQMARCIAQVRATGQRVVVVHGNGPQVGNLAIQQESGEPDVPAQPLHQLCAMTQGQLGSALVLEIDRECGRGSAVAVVTHVEVDPADPAFADPVKPVGPFFAEQEALARAAARGWVVREDAGRGWRRVVPSPMPHDVLELAAVEQLVEGGFVVVAAGGGGIGVHAAADADGAPVWRGVDGVIDKDYAAAGLAAALGATSLYLITGVDEVLLDYGTPQQRAVHRLDVAEARERLAEEEFAAGSMAPKIAAAVGFVEAGGERAVITSTRRLAAAAAGDPEAGTSVVAAPVGAWR